MTVDNLGGNGENGDFKLFVNSLRIDKVRAPYLDDLHQGRTSFIEAQNGIFVVTNPFGERSNLSDIERVKEIFRKHKEFYKNQIEGILIG